jgi:hypothetical protein
MMPNTGSAAGCVVIEADRIAVIEELPFGEISGNRALLLSLLTKLVFTTTMVCEGKGVE